MNLIVKKVIDESQQFNLSTKSAWMYYLERGQLTEDRIRSEILNSWAHSKELGVNPYQQQISEMIDPNELMKRREQNEQLLTLASPKIASLYNFLQESKTVLSLTDQYGTIIQTKGEPGTIKRAETLNIYDGGTWSEQSAGTNAVGVTLKTKRPVQVFFSEHFCEKNHQWYCVAAPILAPFTNELVGIVNISGDNPNMHRHTLGLIIAEANNTANTVLRSFFHQAVKEHLFLQMALEQVGEAVWIVDGTNNIVNRNRVAKEHIIFSSIQTIEELEPLAHLLSIVKKERRMLKEEVMVIKQRKKLICSIHPVEVQGRYMGAVLFLKEQGHLPSPARAERKMPASSTRYTFQQMIGESQAMKRTISLAKKAASIDVPLFLTGETGTGKELFAQSIHAASTRCRGPFVAINCGAIPPSLVESELFGYEAGAFTGAKSKGQAGKFELAQNGTIFLDEIAELPLTAQVQLLRVLEERVVTRIGGNQPIPLDIRVIAATHKNLHQAVQEGMFRADLYYRLRVIELAIPPLRERASDIPIFIRKWMQHMSASFGKQQVHISPEAMQALTAYSWPGNVRELKNVMQQTLFQMEGDHLTLIDLPAVVQKALSPEQEREEAQLIEALKSTNGNITKAADLLQISRATMYRKIKKFSITEEDWLQP
ncbi:sigma-54-dependent Fis family transcriptional regulator [Bacillus xiapuensis]|uniref:sigma-54-dependent Fis family transcriptional regulator n=1 Tax=Bacillus xiapuensis TaxID=2014075 RepID=UPI000C231EA1|nr:sigma-54-dependent Fis family transcriptional regulator [Bacillus xiapuensis]